MSHIISALIICALTLASFKTAGAQEVSLEDKYASYIKGLMVSKDYPEYQGFIHGFIKKGQYAELDTVLTALQSAYESGKIDDIALRYAVEPLNDQTDINLESFYDAWIEAMPRSYMARTARAFYHYQIAWKIRSTKYASDVSQKQYDGFYRQLLLSSRDHQAAIPLTGKPYLSYLGLIAITGEAPVLNRELKTSDMLLKANAIDPQNFWARQNFLRFLQPRWRGSHEEMAAFVGEAEKQGLVAEKLALLRSAMLVDQALDAEYRQKDYAKAAELYSQAAQLQMPFQFLKVGQDGLKGYIRVKQELAQNNVYDDQLFSALNMLINQSGYVEDEGRFYGIRGHLHITKAVQGDQSHFRLGWDDFVKGSNLGDGFSTFKVASTYCEGFPGIVDRDVDRCKNLMKVAAEKGSLSAQGVMKSRWGETVEAVEPAPQEMTKAARGIPASDLPAVSDPAISGQKILMDVMIDLFMPF